MEKPIAVTPVSADVPRRSRSVRYGVLHLLAAVLFVGAYFRFTRSTPEIDPFAALSDALQENLAGNWSYKYTQEPHLAGTNYGLVEWTKAKFEEYGLKATIDTYDIYVSYPDSHDLNILESGKVTYKAPLKEDAIKEDPTSLGNDTVPTFLGYGANGNVTAEYVYVNYGSREDFARLKKLGVDVWGKIAVARYGGIFRGLKVKFAQDEGAVGVLLYSDPGDDAGITPANGFKQYPHGPARHESSVQRGSVQFLGGEGAAPGDPTTPGWASKGDADRVDPHGSIGKIPVLPISYREVLPILEKLNGHGVKAPKEWRGELEGFDYYIGPNPNVTMNLYSKQNFTITPLWNVYGEFEGENPHEAIIIGNHRDAWIKGGAGDPNSGSAVLIEVARALGALKDAGYKFKRSIILQSYDGEEYGLLGSTEYGEYAAKKLQKDVVAYLNMDVAVVGRYLHLSASPVLNRALRAVTKMLPYPGKEFETLYDHFVKERGDHIGNLGSGSDYTVFLEHLGIPSVDFGFSSGKGDAIYQYHSNYDSYHWMEKYGDKNFTYHNLAAKYMSYLAVHLSDHKVIDFSLREYASSLIAYFEQLKEIIPIEWYGQSVSPKAMEEYLGDNGGNEWYIYEVSQQVYRSAMRYMFPELMVPTECRHHSTMQMFKLDSHKKQTFGDIVVHTQDQLEALVKIADKFDLDSAILQAEYEHRDELPWWRRIKLYFHILHHNKLIQYFERNFLYAHGLHQRSWFKHIVYAAGRYTGYAGQTWPGIREAVEDKDFNRTVKWLGIAAKSARRAGDTLA